MLAYGNVKQPWNSIHPTLILLPKCKTLKDVNQIHARLITTGLVKNRSLTTKILISLASSPHQTLVEFARYIFFSQSKHCTAPFLWNAIIKSFSHGSDPERAILLFSIMLENGVAADRFSFSLVLKACSRLGFVREGLQIQCLLWKSAFWSDVFLLNCLVSFYVRCGFVELARRVFDRMPERDSISWNSMIDGYLKNGMVGVARELFDMMGDGEKNLVSWNSMISGYARLEEGVEVAREMFDQMPERDLVSWNSMIDGYVKCGLLEDAHELFDLMPERDVVTWASMIHGYAKSGSVEAARHLFDEMPERDVVAWNVMVAGYVQNGHCVDALKLFQKMRFGSNLSPDHTTLVTALSAAAELGRIDEGITIHDYIERNKFPLDGKLGVALIDMYSKCGRIENAARVFENLEHKSVDHWNAMIGGLAIHGLGELALHLFMEMEKSSIKPDDITFIGILSACSHAGLVKEGLMCFELMRRLYNVEPKVQHYGCIVDILGRAGHLEEAKKLIEEMPIKPNDVVWRALLSACRNHGNFSIGQQAAKQLIELDSCNSSSYVLLSNLYAGVGMWSDASKVRMMMKEREMRKIPGCSWIELNGTVHEFVVGDKSHPQAKEIYVMLDKICAF
ncbi:pentatricopeptide repeat-containing protein At2g45350, chloroplastic [Magnolia sinica]|uniref:pentatricopeptide repeat-containing protein At2g45350, chloroplastic n=1 Tax=Magnolia sinica TaxID=86752 RepID=UPI00265A0A6A|nr:pentatricopeptide repeat-containing protein At2g45350, chloroplastic [Magnolia sinica]